MSDPKIQLLVFDGCPLAEAARSSLHAALESLDSLDSLDFEEIDLLDPSTPDELRDWGSPTILVNGDDVTDNAKGNGVGCRVYDGETGVPSPETIAKRIRCVASSE
jgi:mercuric ion transport protein